MVTLSRKDWRAIIAYVRSEEKILRDSHGTPKTNYRDWERQLKRADPDGFALFEKARKAIRSVR